MSAPAPRDPSPDGDVVRVAVCGKGGSGKTALVALLARELRARGTSVLAVDLDTSPGLALSFGLEPDQIRLPTEAVEEDEDATYGFDLARDLDPTDAVWRYAAAVTDDLRVLGFGDVDAAGHRCAERLTAVETIFGAFQAPGWAVLGDVEPGPARPFEGLTRRADVVLVMVEATTASCWSAQRILSVLRSDDVDAALVVSRVRDDRDVDVVRAQVPGVDVWAAIPDDPAVARAERTGSLLALDASSPAAAAVAALADRIPSHARPEVIRS